MSEIVERLREMAEWFVYEGMPERTETCEKAAAEIERLEARVREARSVAGSCLIEYPESDYQTGRNDAGEEVIAAIDGLSMREMALRRAREPR